MRELIFRFPLDRWSSLYSLAVAMADRHREGDQRILLKGPASFENRSCTVELELERHHEMPARAYSARDIPVLGTYSMLRTEEGETLQGRIPVPVDVFTELLKNLVEYSGIDGIQVLITLGVEAESEPGDTSHNAYITRLDYAMRSQFAV